jgi:GNAT superfamily N-acetyltransferase
VSGPRSGARVTTRRAWPADAETMVRTARLGQETWRAFAPRGWALRAVGEHVADTRAWLARPGAWGVLAFLNGEPAGHAAMFPGNWEEARSAILWGLFVRPAWWGSGLADALHEAFIAHARASGYPYAWLATPAGHARARRFYERRGWHASGPPETWIDLPVIAYRRAVG